MFSTTNCTMYGYVYRPTHVEAVGQDGQEQFLTMQWLRLVATFSRGRH